jgi:hypothetical protein
MSLYTVPDDLTPEQLQQLKLETDAELGRVREQVDGATGDAKNDLRDKERRLEWKANVIETRLNRADTSQLRGIVNQHTDEIRSLQAGLGKLASKQDKNNTELSDRVAFVEAFCLQLRDSHDNLANEVKKQNAIVYRLIPGDANGAVEEIFAEKSGLLTLVDDAFFLGKGPEKKPLKIHFKTVTAAGDFLKWARTPNFHATHPTLSAGRDVTTLRRVGVSRLTAACDALRSKYGDALHVNPSFNYITVGGCKYDALDFASPCALIDGELFDVEAACRVDVEAACRANVNFKPSESLSVEQGNTTTGGYQKIDRANAEAGDNSGKHQAGTNKRGRGRGGGFGGGSGSQRGGGAPRGGSNQRGRGGGSQSGRAGSSMLPPVSGLTSGNVYLHNGPGAQYLNRQRLDLVGAVPDRFASRATCAWVRQHL